MLATKIKISDPMVAAAREGKFGNRRMCVMFTDSATNTRPARAAEALAAAMKKSVHKWLV